MSFTIIIKTIGREVITNKLIEGNGIKPIKQSKKTTDQSKR